MDYLDIYPVIREDFQRLKSAGLKFSPKVLLLVAKNALPSTPHLTFFLLMSVLDNDDQPLINKITPRWVQQF